MGTYTQIASLGRFSMANQRRRAPRLDGPAAAQREEAPAPYFCPACGDGSVVASECGRCGEAMRPSAGAIVLPPRHDGRDANRRSLVILGLVLVTAFGAPALLFASLGVMDRAQYGHSALANLGWASALAGAGALVFLLAALATFSPSLGARLRELSRRRRASRRATKSALHLAAALPARADGLVRLRGRLRVRGDRLAIEDDTGRARVRLGPEVRVYDERGERTVLGDGEEVEVVGLGARPVGAGDAYRDARGDFTFEATQPLDIWIR